MLDDRMEGLTPAPLVASPRRKSRNWLGWGLAALIIVGCLFFIDVGQVVRVVRRMEGYAIVLVLLLLTADRVLMALKWRLLLGIGGAHLSPLAVIGIYYQGWLVGALLPSHVGGDVLRAHLVAQRTGVRHPAFASLVMEKLIGLLSAVNWAILGGIVLAVHLAPGYWALWLLLGLLVAVAFNGTFLLSLHQSVHDFALGLLARHQQRKLLGLLHKFYDAYAAMSRHPRVLLANFLLTLLEHGLQLLIIFTIARSLEVHAETVLFFAASAVQTLILRIPIVPDGWGTGELAAIGAFGLIGIGAAAAFTISVIYRFLGLAAVLPGFVLFLLLPQEISRREVAARQPPQWIGGVAGLRSRLPMYLAGCVLFSLGVKLFIDADLGVDPFHAMTIGLVHLVDEPLLQIGVMDGIVTAVLLVLWVAWNRKLPPLSTFGTMLLVGLMVDFWNWVDLELLTERLRLPELLMLAGLMLDAYGSALIIMSGIGIRVVDLVALTFVNRLGWRFYRAKLILEGAFLVAGILLGGPVGIAAVAFVAVVGPFVEPFIWANRRFLNLPDYGLRPAMRLELAPVKAAAPRAPG
jgi:uncharacterized protein